MLNKTLVLTIVFVTGFLVSSSVIADPQASANAIPDTAKESNTDFGKKTNPSKNTTPSKNTAPLKQKNSNSQKIKRSQFTSAVVDREPTDNVVMLTNNSREIYFFTELSDLKGQTITHRWQYQGKPVAEVKFEVKSDRWRVFSSKKIKPAWTGEWSVVLVDENGNSLDVSKLEIVEVTPN
jgi:hypothetical protein